MTRGPIVMALFATACASRPSPRDRPDAAPDDPFVACVAPHRVEVARDEAGTAIVTPLASTPRELSGLAAAADGCGTWIVGDDAPAYVRAFVEHERCGTTCAAGWEGKLARDVARAPTTPTRCDVDGDAGWRGWVTATLLEAPGLDADAWVERAMALGRAGIGTAEEHIEARMADADPDEAAALGRASLAKLPYGAESLRFRSALALVRVGDIAAGRIWLNQIAELGRTAFRAFARAELTRLDAGARAVP